MFTTVRKIQFVSGWLDAFKINHPMFVAKYKYFKGMHRWPNISNPKDFNEKIIHMLYHTDVSKWTLLADKYKVYDYIAAKGYEDILIPRYGAWSDAQDIDFDALPESFVMKVNCTSGSVAVVEDKKNSDLEAVRRQMADDMALPMWSLFGEIHYRDIKPMIVAEKLLINDSTISSSIIDYKFFCFGGKPEFCKVCLNRNIAQHGYEEAYYDISWNRCDKLWTSKKIPLFSGNVARPVNYERMLEICRVFGKEFPFVRIDLYEIGGKLYFGEFTFTPGGFIPTLSKKQQRYLGSLIKLPVE